MTIFISGSGLFTAIVFCFVFLVFWRGPGRGGSRIRGRASLGTVGPFDNFVVSREGRAGNLKLHESVKVS